MFPLLVLDTVHMIFAVVDDSWTSWSHDLCTLLLLDTVYMIFAVVR